MIFLYFMKRSLWNYIKSVFSFVLKKTIIDHILTEVWENILNVPDLFSLNKILPSVVNRIKMLSTPIYRLYKAHTPLTLDVSTPSFLLL